LILRALKNLLIRPSLSESRLRVVHERNPVHILPGAARRPYAYRELLIQIRRQSKRHTSASFGVRRGGF
jgi:hypothetical protein